MKKLSKKEQYIQEIKEQVGSKGLFFYSDIFDPDRIKQTPYESKIKMEWLVENNYSLITAREYREKVCSTDEVRNYYGNTLFIINYSIIRKNKIKKALNKEPA